MKSILLLILVFLYIGCAVKYRDVKLTAQGEPGLVAPNPILERKISRLQKMLRDLAPDVDPEEAKDLAKISVLYPHWLADRYKLLSPPNFQNFMINIGLRKRGFCYHWMHDLGRMLGRRGYKTMDLYYAVAYYDTIREHNAVVVTAKNAPFRSGIVLDAWRDSGETVFAPLSKDSYPWRLRGPIR